MTLNDPIQMQGAVLRVLFDRATKGHWADASLSRPRISELLNESIGVRLSPAVLQIYLDDLVSIDLVSMPPRGVRDRFQITAKGIKHVDGKIDVESDRVAPQAWTGDLDRRRLTDEDADKIIRQIKQLSVVIEKTELSNAERAQATALVTAAVCMAEAPVPPWETIKQVLLLIGSVSTVLAFALEIAKLIR